MRAFFKEKREPVEGFGYHRPTLWLSASVVLIIGLITSAVGEAAPADDPTTGIALDLNWDTSDDPSFVKRAERTDPLRVICTVSGVDSLAGFQILLRIRGVGKSKTGAWLFRDSLGCSGAGYQADARRDPAAPAPWTQKLYLSELKYGGKSGAAVIIVAGTFDLAALDPDSRYNLCTIDLTPPGAMEAGECGGWDSPAVLDLVGAKVLLTRGRSLPLEVPRKTLALQLKEPD